MKNIIDSIITYLSRFYSCNNYSTQQSSQIEKIMHKKEQQLPIPETKKRVSKGLINRRNAEIELWKKK